MTNIFNIICDKCYKPFYSKDSISMKDDELVEEFIYLHELRDKYMEHINSLECKKISIPMPPKEDDWDKMLEMGF